MNAIELSLFSHRLGSICEEMGAALRRSAISPNIRDREDYSCALFDCRGELIAQAAHIPVHLGSMAFAMRDVVGLFDWRQGDAIIFNDPFLGGTHLPDVTIVMPLFVRGMMVGFAATRAHHADIGGASPGSMGIETRLADEGVIFEPQYWFREGVKQAGVETLFQERVRAPEERIGDLAAQLAACRLAQARLQEWESETLTGGFSELLEASEVYGRKAIEAIPDGSYRFEDKLEGDGVDSGPLPIRVEVRIDGSEASVDFTGTASQCRGPLNCPLAVTAAAVFYVFRCLMPAQIPQTSAIFRPIRLLAPEGSLVHARQGAAVAAGNVETSQRIVDVMLGALSKALPEHMPAASQGTMNNVIFGGISGDGEAWVYYETLAGGMGAHAHGDGLSAVQCHMTNTRNTSIEVLEMHYPLRIRHYGIRNSSGGAGRYRGGDGLVREWEVLAPCHLSLLTERRELAPWGIRGGMDAKKGLNAYYHKRRWHPLPGKGSWSLQAGDRVRIATPGGGGYGQPETEGSE